MIMVLDTIGYCPKAKKWFLYNAETYSKPKKQLPSYKYYDTFEQATISLEAIKKRYHMPNE